MGAQLAGAGGAPWRGLDGGDGLSQSGVQLQDLEWSPCPVRLVLRHQAKDPCAVGVLWKGVWWACPWGPHFSLAALKWLLLSGALQNGLHKPGPSLLLLGPLLGQLWHL
jgi:hypothetical protein